MSDEPASDPAIEEQAIEDDAVETTAASSTYKVLGKFADSSGAGVLGHNTATTSPAIGVQGVTDASSGYGLHTPDDARAEGNVEIGNSLVGSGVVGTTNLEAGAVTSTEIADGSVTSTDIQDGTISTADLGPNGAGNDDVFKWNGTGWTTGPVDTGSIAVNAVTAAEIATGTVTSNQISDGTIGPWDFRQSGASDGHVFRWNGTQWETGFPGTMGSTTAFKLYAGGYEALRIEPNDLSDENVIVGDSNTAKDANTNGMSITGGGYNVVADDYCTVGGGYDNTAGVDDASDSTASNATVAGGYNNEASGSESFVGGGQGNVASGDSATVPGGYDNIAADSFSFAAGVAANATDYAAFVWNDGSGYHDYEGDSTKDGFSSAKAVNGESVTGAYTFNVSAGGGVRFVTGGSSVTHIPSSSTGWSTSSSRSVKTDVEPVDPEEILEGVEDLEVATWEYEDEDGEGTGRRHVGPMAEDFHEVVDVGDSDEHINSVDARGVLFAAVQGLSAKLDERDDRIDDLREETNSLREENVDLRAKNERLRERLDAVEAHLDLDAGTAGAVADD